MKPLLAAGGGCAIETLIINVLLVLMAVTVACSARSRNLFGVVILGGVYSFLMATVLVALDAVDVAMTEASVGAGISTVLFLSALFLCKSRGSPAAAQALAAARRGRWRWARCWSTARWDCRSSPIRTRRSTSTSCRAI